MIEKNSEKETNDSNKSNDASPSTNRIEAFSDGVFAIVITLLVLDLKVPPNESPTQWNELLQTLLKLAPKFLGLVLSFFFVAIFWVAHHQFFHTLKISTRILVWMNVLFLFFVTFIPFPTALLGEYPNNKSAVVLFGATFFAASGVFALLRWYGWVKGDKTSEEFKLKSLKKAMQRTFFIPILYVVGMFVAVFDTKIAIGLYFLTPILLIIPLRLETRSKKKEDLVI